MKDQRLNYAGIGGAVAGVVGLLGIYADWWETDTTVYHGTADISGQLALAMSIGLFAFGAAYVLSSDQRIRRAMGALMTLFAVVLTLACVWGLQRADNVAPGASTQVGLWVSLLGGVMGIAASMLAVKYASDEDASADSGDERMSAIGGTEHRGPWSGQRLCQSRVEAEASQVVGSRCPAVGDLAVPGVNPRTVK